MKLIENDNFIQINGSNISTPTNYEIGFVNYTGGTPNNFTPNARTVFTQQLDFAGVGGTVSVSFINKSNSRCFSSS